MSHVDRGKDARRGSANFAGLRPVPDGTGLRLLQRAPMGSVKWEPGALSVPTGVRLRRPFTGVRSTRESKPDRVRGVA